MNRLLLLLTILVFIVSCKTNKCEQSSSLDLPETNVKIERLDKELFEQKSKAALTTFLKKNTMYSRVFLNAGEYPSDSLFFESIYELVNNPHIDTLHREVEQAYGDISDLQQQFNSAFSLIKYHFPGYHVPKIKTAVSGLKRDLYISDSLIIVGLDFFLGEDSKFKPIQVPEYIQKRYQKEYITPSVIMLLSNYFNQTAEADNSMIADMVFFGKAYYFTKEMLPCVNDTLISGYSGKDIEGINDNIEAIWAHFIEKELLYETSHFIKDKYMDERPKTVEISQECPGRIGRWLGWEIVNKYMEQQSNPSIKKLMEEQDARKIFMRSKYKPKGR